MFAADSAGAFASFGGAIGQFSNIGVLLSNAITDSPAVAIKYGQHRHNKLSTLARERTPSIDYYNLLSAEQFDIKRYVTAGIPSGAKSKKGDGKKGDKASGPGERNEWAPTNVYSKAAAAAGANPLLLSIMKNQRG